MNTIRIPLTRGYEALIDAADLPLIEGRPWCASVARSGVYAIHSRSLTDRKRTNNWACERMHRTITNAVGKVVVDHINGNTLDNRRENLRVVTNRFNILNTDRARSSSSTGVLNVYRDKDKFLVRVSDRGTHINCGRYSSIEDAAVIAYQARLMIFGPDAIARLPRPNALAGWSLERISATDLRAAMSKPAQAARKAA